MTPIVKENNQVLDLLHSIDRRIRRLESVLVEDQIDEEDDEWLNDPKVRSLILRRAKEVSHERKKGTLLTLDQLKDELGM